MFGFRIKAYVSQRSPCNEGLKACDYSRAYRHGFLCGVEYKLDPMWLQTLQARQVPRGEVEWHVL